MEEERDTLRSQLEYSELRVKAMENALRESAAQLAALREAAEAVGCLPDGYCFCFGHTRDARKPEAEHTGECRQLRAALDAAREKP
jgi:hypothetical protein